MSSWPRPPGQRSAVGTGGRAPSGPAAALALHSAAPASPSAGPAERLCCRFPGCRVGTLQARGGHRAASPGGLYLGKRVACCSGGQWSCCCPGSCLSPAVSPPCPSLLPPTGAPERSSLKHPPPRASPSPRPGAWGPGSSLHGHARHGGWGLASLVCTRQKRLAPPATRLTWGSPHLCIFWVTFIFAIGQRRKESNMCLQAFSRTSENLYRV